MMERLGFVRIPNDVAAAWNASSEALLLISISANASKCTVQGSEMLCSDLASHLEHSLKLPKTTPIALVAPDQTNEAHIRLVKTIKDLGYSHAAVLVSKSETKYGGQSEESK